MFKKGTNVFGNLDTFQNFRQNMIEVFSTLYKRSFKILCSWIIDLYGNAINKF